MINSFPSVLIPSWRRRTVHALVLCAAVALLLLMAAQPAFAETNPPTEPPSEQDTPPSSSGSLGDWLGSLIDNVNPGRWFLENVSGAQAFAVLSISHAMMQFGMAVNNGTLIVPRDCTAFNIIFCSPPSLFTSPAMGGIWDLFRALAVALLPFFLGFRLLPCLLQQDDIGNVIREDLLYWMIYLVILSSPAAVVQLLLSFSNTVSSAILSMQSMDVVRISFSQPQTMALSLAIAGLLHVAFLSFIIVWSIARILTLTFLFAALPIVGVACTHPVTRATIAAPWVKHTIRASIQPVFLAISLGLFAGLSSAIGGAIGREVAEDFSQIVFQLLGSVSIACSLFLVNKMQDGVAQALNASWMSARRNWQEHMSSRASQTMSSTAPSTALSTVLAPSMANVMNMSPSDIALAAASSIIHRFKGGRIKQSGDDAPAQDVDASETRRQVAQAATAAALTAATGGAGAIATGAAGSGAAVAGGTVTAGSGAAVMGRSAPGAMSDVPGFVGGGGAVVGGGMPGSMPGSVPGSRGTPGSVEGAAINPQVPAVSSSSSWRDRVRQMMDPGDGIVRVNPPLSHEPLGSRYAPSGLASPAPHDRTQQATHGDASAGVWSDGRHSVSASVDEGVGRVGPSHVDGPPGFQGASSNPISPALDTAVQMSNPSADQEQQPWHERVRRWMSERDGVVRVDPPLSHDPPGSR